MSDSDRTWRHYGATDPYYGVLTAPEFTSDRLTDEGRERFFATGADYVSEMLALVRADLDPSFAPRRALDFGCGVGRLSIPLARVCDEVVGVDISEAMLDEARSNSTGLENTTFVVGDDDLSAVTGRFDLVNSFIVFQHIPVDRGLRIFSRLLDLLDQGGVGMLQFTYAFASSTPRWRRAVTWAYHRVPGVWGVRNLLKRRPFGEPMMHMNRYDLNDLLRRLQEQGCHRLRIRFTETGFLGEPFYGVTLIFQKAAEPTAKYG